MLCLELFGEVRKPVIRQSIISLSSHACACYHRSKSHQQAYPFWIKRRQHMFQPLNLRGQGMKHICMLQAADEFGSICTGTMQESGDMAQSGLYLANGFCHCIGICHICAYVMEDNPGS